MAGVSQILSQRISLTVRNLTDQITIYKAYNLLLFYQDIFTKLLGITPSQPDQQKQQQQQSHTLLSTLSTLSTQSQTHFQTTVSEDIEAHSISLASSSSPSNSSLPPLQPPGILQSNLALFANILHLRAPNLTPPEFSTLYSTLLSPVLDLCGTAATALSPDDNDDEAAGDSFETTIYRLNYMAPIVATLTALARDDLLSDFVVAPMRSAEGEVGKLTGELAEAVADRFLDKSGVQGLLGRVAEFIGGEKGEEEDAEGRKAQLDRLEGASVLLDTFLATALMDGQDELARLGDKGVAKVVLGEAVETFCQEFERLVNLLESLDEEFEEKRGRLNEQEDGNGGNENENEAEDEVVFFREAYPRTVAEVRALLS